MKENDIRGMVQQIESLEVEKGEVVGSLREKITEAKDKGFHLQALGMARRFAKMTSGQRIEFKTCFAIYAQALGIHDGDPLPPSARRRLDSKDPHGERDPNQTDIEDKLAEDIPPPPPEPKLEPQETQEQAFDRGRAAHKEGRPVTANPYPFMDPRQAKWDEGWCLEDGSNGMEIPKSWQRATPKKKKDDNGGDGADG
jgi:uncharacterized protein (UPF0335 family)